jgi:GntR family transcriptional regulator, transcriptional repressor for pyruvate dehydrogenase complex
MTVRENVPPKRSPRSGNARTTGAVSFTTEESSNEQSGISTPRSAKPLFEPVKTRRAFEEVCNQIRAQLAAGTLVPGDRLPPERELAEQLGVSRTAIREALRTLEVAGLVYCQTGMNGGAFIKEGGSAMVSQAVQDMVILGQTTADSVSEARIHITCLAIRLACVRGTSQDFKAIEADIDHSEQLTRQGDFSRRTTYITEFYRVVARATHNEVIVMLVDALSEITRMLLERIDPTPRSNVVDVRRRVLSHLRARDADAAVAEMTAHLEGLNKYIKSQEKSRRPKTGKI